MPKLNLLKIILLVVLLGGCRSQLAIFQDDLLSAHNIERQKRSLPPLKSDSDLDVFAQKHASQMAKTQKLKHQSLDGLLKRWGTAGENIACGQENTEKVMHDWMNSSGHRKNILNKDFSHMGVGKAVSPDGTIYWCTDFGGK